MMNKKKRQIREYEHQADLQTQKDMKRLVGARSVCLDAYGTDSSGKKYDLSMDLYNPVAGYHFDRYNKYSFDTKRVI